MTRASTPDGSAITLILRPLFVPVMDDDTADVVVDGDNVR